MGVMFTTVSIFSKCCVAFASNARQKPVKEENNLHITRDTINEQAVDIPLSKTDKDMRPGDLTMISPFTTIPAAAAAAVLMTSLTHLHRNFCRQLINDD
jgi:hypothetical protein